MKTMLVRVFAVLLLALFAGALLVQFKLQAVESEIAECTQTKLVANSIVRQVLAGTIAGGNFSMGETNASVDVYDEALKKTVDQITKLEGLVKSDSGLMESVQRLRKLVEKTDKVAQIMRAQMADRSNMGMGSMLLAMKAVRSLYALVDKISAEIDSVISITERKADRLSAESSALVMALYGQLAAGVLLASASIFVSGPKPVS